MVVVVGAEGGRRLGERLAAVSRPLEAGGQQINHLIVGGIDADLAVVERAVVIPVEKLPGLAAVLGAVDAGAQLGHVGAVGVGRGSTSAAALEAVLHDGHDDLGILAIDVQANAAGVAGRQPGSELLPGSAAVGGFEDTAAGTAAVESPRLPQALGEGGDEHFGIVGVDDQIGRAGFAVVGQTGGELLPGAAAVGGLEYPAIAGIAPEVADGGGVDDIGVGGMSDYAGDLKGVLEAHVGKCPAAVGGFIDAVAPGHAVAVIGLAGAHPENLWVLLEHGDGR